MKFHFPRGIPQIIIHAYGPPYGEVLSRNGDKATAKSFVKPSSVPGWVARFSNRGPL